MTSLGTTFRAVVVEVFGVQSTWRLVKYRPDATYVGDGAAIVKRKDFAEGEWPPRVWIPLLGEGQLVQLERINDHVKPKETSPVIPSPSLNPRRGDDLVIEYHRFLFEELQIDPRNIIYAAERNPFEVYRQLNRTIRYYRRALAPLGGCRFALSALSSKLISTGALLVAYELRPDRDVGVAHIECQGYSIEETGGRSELFGLWLSGECYEP